jgi:hypothetical protein
LGSEMPRMLEQPVNTSRISALTRGDGSSIFAASPTLEQAQVVRVTPESETK